MNRRMIRGVVAGGAIAASVLCGGTAFADETAGTGGAGATYGEGVSGGGGAVTPGGTSGGGSTGSTEYSTSTSNGGAAETSTGGSSGGLPYTGFELATALAVGVGAIGAGSIVVVSARKRRSGGSALA